MNKNLEQEIEQETKNIEEKQRNINSEVDKLNDKIERYTTYTWVFVWLGVVIAITSSIYFYCISKGDDFELNVLGDFLGGSVASLWALAGLFLIYVAFLGQKQQLLNQQLELLYSRLEVKNTRLELSGQKEELNKQNETLQQQKFENTFFQLITLFHSIVDSLDIRNYTGEITSSGRDCFEIFYNELKEKVDYINSSKRVEKYLDETPVNNVIEAYDEIYQKHKSDLSHYFRTIYHIFKFVENSNISNKKQYSSITRAQLSSYEQILLFYNCLHTNGVKKFKPLIEKYAVFKNIDESLLFSDKHLLEYKKSAQNNY